MQIIKELRDDRRNVLNLNYIFVWLIAVICLLNFALPALAETCSTCHGTGKSISCEYTPAYSGITTETYCSTCGTTGRSHYHKPCPSCGGKGYYTTVRETINQGGGSGVFYPPMPYLIPTAPYYPSGGSQRNVAPANPLKAVYANKRAGERFEFGRYPQGPNGEVKPMTWRVLKREGNALPVISEFCLDARRYNTLEREDIVWSEWSECTLRRWLNGEFLQKAFNGQEQALIKTSRLDNNAGPVTDDRVFLLSIGEYESLFANKADRTAKPTAYATKHGLKEFSDHPGIAALWWLRSPYRNASDAAAAVIHVGGFDAAPVYFDGGGVRPVLRLALLFNP